MRVWLLTVGETLPMLEEGARKMRTAVLAQELAARGHEVVWWTSTIDHLRKRKIAEGSVTKNWGARVSVEFLDGPLYTSSLSLNRYLNHLVVAGRFILAARRRPRPDILVASYPTPELAAAAAFEARRVRARIIVDVRDLWPEELLAQLPPPLRWPAVIATWPMRSMLGYALRRAVSVTAVSQSYLDWAMQKSRRLFPREPTVFPLGYQAPARDLDRAGAMASLVRRGVDPSRSLFAYITTLNSGADIQMVVNAARLLETRNVNAQIIVAGAGGSEEELQRLIGGLATAKYVGWLEAIEIAGLLSASCGGLALYRAHSQVSLSNKFFEYMSFGLPIVLSLGGEAGKFVQEENIGAYVEPSNAEALADAIARLTTDDTYRATQAANARRLFDERFKADQVYAKFADFIETCAVS